MFTVTKQMLTDRITEFNKEFKDTLSLQPVYKNHYNLVRMSETGTIKDLLVSMENVKYINLYFTGYSYGKREK